MSTVARAKALQSGSSVKFCRLAEGKADLYPRFAPTHDWDIAAGHAILQSAGGSVTAPDGAAVIYGTRDLLVPAFRRARQNQGLSVLITAGQLCSASAIT